MSGAAPATPDWAKDSGDVWAQRWRETDRALAALSEPLVATVAASAPAGRFKAFEIGCGPGTTTLEVADVCPSASIVACDISPSLAHIAQDRTAGRSNIFVLVGDAEEVAASAGPFDIIYSRHGVMFFADPVRAFACIRDSAASGAALVFSCFRDWRLNDWARIVADAVAADTVPPPGRESGAFAFAEPDYVRRLLEQAGWQPLAPEPIDFTYVAAEGPEAIDAALSFFSAIGPAARLIATMDEAAQSSARERMRAVLERHAANGRVTFPAAAWIWKATAA